ncbi:hypothetical protein AN2465.2 [Aspergillus nidulans FGSC A4]|uniref:Major facilitator superfamily (MFS) profile domain-containing protein n=1 Tax=Emericella nidulans (strain FGSC A4 / ATCC 38163 / CBS 112.46 / NRRL 194 / M139) TaxID=227321 RepID=Q5BAG5_EMENI|nr:hypothetical protein [Aspergillus nidulans FGSC A4]EAA64171.1 hypothetical protein AN2465.2 [Aspergillus nidulans FGSC A4]CBF86911.1 TPA: hypothetical protein ANIA_02465 [Aspergillus nidulans FGSC A4]|eukprot:XP_660069.1 hypothetical protein AN2465.2 [Aspergillus nidulans FGSC A4]
MSTDYEKRLSLDDMALKTGDHIETIGKAAAVDATVAANVDDIPISLYVWMVALSASIAGMLFGYDTGIISAVLVYIKDALGGRYLTSSEKELITSLCSGGAFFGSIFAGNTADRWGRKTALYLGCVLFVVGAVLQAAAYTIAQMAVGRVIVGFGVGSAAMIVPLYVAEIAPSKARGRLVGLNNVSITGGQVIAYAIGAAFASVPHGWRVMVGLGGLPPIVLACLLPFCPESPRHLVYNGRMEEARAVLRKLYRGATDVQIESVLASILAGCEEARAISGNEGGWAKIVRLHTVPSNFRALLCACGLMVLSQISGFNTLMYYSSTIFSLVGFTSPTAVGLVVAGTNLIMTFANMILVDRLGRRRLLLSTVWGMSAGLIAVSVAFSFIHVDVNATEVTPQSVTTPAIVVLIFIIWFVVFYGVSVGNTAWMSADFFPLEVRAMGTMWMTCSSWASNVIVSSTFLSMTNAMTMAGTFGFYAGICGVSYVLIYFFYPEVSGLILEEIKEVFEHGFGVSTYIPTPTMRSRLRVWLQIGRPISGLIDRGVAAFDGGYRKFQPESARCIRAKPSISSKCRPFEVFVYYGYSQLPSVHASQNPDIQNSDVRKIWERRIQLGLLGLQRVTTRIERKDKLMLARLQAVPRLFLEARSKAACPTLGTTSPLTSKAAHVPITRRDYKIILATRQSAEDNGDRHDEKMPWRCERRKRSRFRSVTTRDESNERQITVYFLDYLLYLTTLLQESCWKIVHPAYGLDLKHFDDEAADPRTERHAVFSTGLRVSDDYTTKKWNIGLGSLQ